MPNKISRNGSKSQSKMNASTASSLVDYCFYFKEFGERIGQQGELIAEELLSLKGPIAIYCEEHHRLKAQHLAEELMGRYRKHRYAIPAIINPQLYERWCAVRFGDGGSLSRQEGTDGVDLRLTSAVHIGDSNLRIGELSWDFAGANPVIFSVVASFVIHLICEAFEPDVEERHSHILGQIEEFPRFWHSFAQNRELIHRIDSHLSDYVKSIRYLLPFGNGGSCCDAEEFRRFKAKHLIDCLFPGYLSCVGNDYGYSELLKRALSPWEDAHGLIVALSTSGNSENINAAYKYLISIDTKLRFIYLGGIRDVDNPGGELAQLMRESGDDENVYLVPRSEYANRIQEAHVAIINYLNLRCS